MQSMRINLIEQDLESRTFKFAWVGTYLPEGRGGYVKVILKENVYNEKDSKIVAELWALRKLLIDEQVLGDIRGLHKIKLVVTNGQIKKLIQAKATTSRHLLPHARFAHTCLSTSIGIEVKKDVLSPSMDTTLEIEAQKENRVYEDTIIGKLEISKHAQERLLERHKLINQGETKNPYKTLLSLLNNGHLRKIELNKKVAKHKKRAHKDAANTEIWTSSDTQFHYTVVREDENVAHLVTIYNRLDKHDQDVEINTWAEREKFEEGA